MRQDGEAAGGAPCLPLEKAPGKLDLSHLPFTAHEMTAVSASLQSLSARAVLPPPLYGAVTAPNPPRPKDLTA